MSVEEGAITGSPAGFTPKPTGPLEAKGRELGRKADEIGSRLQSGLRDKAHEIGAAGHQVREQAAVARDKITNGFQDGRERVTREVQEHPMRTLVWAFGAGALLGLLLGRRSRR